MDQPPAEDISAGKASQVCILESSRIREVKKDTEDVKRKLNGRTSLKAFNYECSKGNKSGTKIGGDIPSPGVRSTP